jgi:hypothetical protein
LARLSDEEVMTHVQAGHDDALAVLFDRYHRLIASPCQLLCLLKGSPPEPHLSLPAAILYAKKVQANTSDGLVRKNAGLVSYSVQVLLSND